jgi:hypothetical protein
MPQHGSVGWFFKIKFVRLPPARANFLWHTICDYFAVAKKFQLQGSSGAVPNLSPEGVQILAVPLLGLRGAPRARRIPTVRRRVPLTVIPEPAAPVIIRHAAPNVGSPVNETQPAQNQRV